MRPLRPCPKGWDDRVGYQVSSNTPGLCMSCEGGAYRVTKRVPLITLGKQRKYTTSSKYNGYNRFAPAKQKIKA